MRDEVGDVGWMRCYDRRKAHRPQDMQQIAHYFPLLKPTSTIAKKEASIADKVIAIPLLHFLSLYPPQRLHLPPASWYQPAIEMPKTISDKKAAELMAYFLRPRGDSLYLERWEQTLKAIIQVFAVKYHELSPEAAGTFSTKRYPSRLLHEFFVKSLRNIMDDLPSDVDKLREAVDALDGKHTSRKRHRTENDEADGKQASRKRRRMDNDEAVEVDIPKGKRAKVQYVSKFKVFTNGQTEVIEFTLDDPSIIDVKFHSAPGRVSTITDNHIELLNDN